MQDSDIFQNILVGTAGLAAGGVAFWRFISKTVRNDKAEGEQGHAYSQLVEMLNEQLKEAMIREKESNARADKITEAHNADQRELGRLLGVVSAQEIQITVLKKQIEDLQKENDALDKELKSLQDRFTNMERLLERLPKRKEDN